MLLLPFSSSAIVVGKCGWTLVTALIAILALFLLREAAWWRLAVLFFLRQSPERREEMAGLMRETVDELLSAAVREETKAECIERFDSLLGPGGPVPVREVSYAAHAQPGYLLAELEAFYRAFAFPPHPGEPPNHAATEFSFLV